MGDFNALKAMFDVFRGEFEILAVPCGQFFNQEPNNGVEITNVMKYVRPGNDFTLDFPMFAKSEINGENRIPLYQFATSRCPPADMHFSTLNFTFTPLSPVRTCGGVL